MGDDGRRKSWRELDRNRDRRGGSTRRRDPDEAGRARAERSGAYGAYKAQLDSMFAPGGTGLPEHLKEKLGPVSEEAAARQQAASDFKKVPSDAAMTAYLAAGFQLPEDARFLMSMFDHLTDEGNVRLVLDRLLEIVEGGKRPNRMLLLQRLTALERGVEDEETVALIGDLRGALD